MGKTILLVFGILSAINGYSQNISDKEIDAAINTMAKLIADNYVFPEKGNAIAKALLQESKKGTFNGLNSWKRFDSATTTFLQRTSHDGHLYVRTDPDIVKQLRTKDTTGTSTSETQPGKDPFFYGAGPMKKNYGFRKVEIFDNNIGYIKLAEICISGQSLPTLYAAMKFVANTSALIIDLRDNGGGGSDTGAVIESFFLPANKPLLEFKSRSGQANLEKTVEWLKEKKYENPLFIIVNGGTASAAEALAFSLQHNKRAKIIGQRSAGGAHMNSWYPVNDQVFVSVSTAAPTIPGTEVSWEQRGVQPDHVTDPGKEIEFILTQIH